MEDDGRNENLEDDVVRQFDGSEFETEGAGDDADDDEYDRVRELFDVRRHDANRQGDAEYHENVRYPGENSRHRWHTLVTSAVVPSNVYA